MKQTVKIPNNLGLKLEVNFFPPETESKKIVILLPGRLDSKDYAHLSKLAELLSDEHFLVISFDPSGTWNSEGDISLYTVSQYLNDIESILSWAKQTWELEEINLVGHSLGGFCSMQYAIQHHTIAHTVAIMSPYAIVRPENRFEIEKWKKTNIRNSKRDVPGKAEEYIIFKTPYSFIEDGQHYNILNSIETINTKLLLLAGDDDKIIPQEHVELLYVHAVHPKSFLILDGVKHDYRRSPESIEKVNREVLLWLTT